MTRGADTRMATVAARVIIGVSSAGLLVGCTQSVQSGELQTALRSTIAFASTRYDAAADPAVDLERAFLAMEIYLSNDDGTNPRRLTDNTHYDGFPSLSPDGTRIVFDSNRRRAAGETFNTSDLFLMNTDGTAQTFLVRGSSATWSPDGRTIAFHASASGRGQPIKVDPGAATSDNDLFVVNVDDLLRTGARPRNITNSPAAIDEDADWSPDGRKIAYTSHAASDDPGNLADAEIYVIDANGAGRPTRLTNNAEEERGPAWSPDGKRIAFSCKRNGPDFEICVMNADGTGQVQLTDNAAPDLTASWSTDGKRILFHRRVGGRGHFQLFSMNSDGTGERQLTFPPGLSAYANWGVLRGAR